VTSAILPLAIALLLWAPGPIGAIRVGRNRHWGIALASRWHRNPPRRRHRGEVDLGMVATEVASRLRAGAPTAQAWHDTLRRYRKAAPAVTNEVDGGGDGVPAGLRGLDVGRDPAGGQRVALRATIAACRLTHEIGAPLAEVLDQCAAGLTEVADARDARQIALAGPRATARLLTWLPVAGAGLGAVIGANPVAVFLDGGWGSAALLSGVACLIAGRRWSAMLVRAAQHGTTGRWGRRSRVGMDSALLLDLAAAALSAGTSLPRTLIGLGRALAPGQLAHQLHTAGALLGLGADWDEAWQEAGEFTHALRDALEPAWCDGADPTALLRRAAAVIRARRHRQAQEDAARLGVRLVLPLGLCLLPAFVLLGLVPLLLSGGGALLAG